MDKYCESVIPVVAAKAKNIFPSKFLEKAGFLPIFKLFVDVLTEPENDPV